MSFLKHGSYPENSQNTIVPYPAYNFPVQTKSDDSLVTILTNSELYCTTEREMCPWAISKYFGDWVPTQVFKCEFMLMDGQSAKQEQRYVSKS
jgi:hypothetical protein